MGYYKNGKYVYTFQDVGFGVCSKEHYNKQRQEGQKKKDKDNAGVISSDLEAVNAERTAPQDAGDVNG